MSLGRADRYFSISYLILDRLVCHIVSYIGIDYFHAFYGIRFAYYDTIFDLCARLGILLYTIYCGLAGRLYRFDYVLYFLMDDFLVMRAGFQVSFSIDGSDRYGVRAGLETLALRIHSRIYGSILTGTFDCACGVLDYP